jgi:hypothetical protein
VLVPVAVTFASICGPLLLALTVSVAGLVVVEPNAFVNVASYFVPLCAVVVADVVYDADVPRRSARTRSRRTPQKTTARSAPHS